VYETLIKLDIAYIQRLELEHKGCVYQKTVPIKH